MGQGTNVESRIAQTGFLHACSMLIRITTSLKSSEITSSTKTLSRATTTVLTTMLVLQVTLYLT